MRTLSEKIVVSLGIFLVILTVILIVSRGVATRAFREQMVAFVTDSCESCTLEIGRVELAIIPPSIILEDVSFSGGNDKTTKVDAEVMRIVARTSFRSLIFRKLDFKSIQVHAPHVVVTEGDLPVTPSRAEEGTHRAFLIDEIDVVSGTFVYIRVFGSGKESRKSILHVEDIEAHVGEMGSTLQLKKERVHGKAKGRLENSGRFALSVETAPFSRPLLMDVDLQIIEQDLADVTLFFETMDGIRMRGKLHRGRSIVKIRENKLTGSVQTEYDGLDVNYEKTESRSKISAFFSNLIKSIKLRPSNIGKTPSDQTRSVEVEREPKEALIHFILRGMKEGALKTTGDL